MDAWPSVSFVVPVLNEERHLREAVGRMLAQEYDGPLEVVLALGPSRDSSDDVAAQLAADDPRVRLVDNPSGATPAGLNRAIAASTGEVVARCDGHSLLPLDYLRVAVGTMLRADADNVGGIMAAEGVTDFEQAVARAMTTRLGVGGAPFHVGGEEGEAPTVYLGVFRRSALERVGGYDESMVRAQDWEMNHRIRPAGGLVWFTPELHVTYRPRPNLRALAKQYFEYGRWRREVARRHPETVSARYLAPPVTLVAVAGGTALGIAGLAMGSHTATILGFALPAGYAAANLLASARAARSLSPSAALRLPAVFATMHGAWGAGFIRGAR